MIHIQKINDNLYYLTVQEMACKPTNKIKITKLSGKKKEDKIVVIWVSIIFLCEIHKAWTIKERKTYWVDCYNLKLLLFKSHFQENENTRYIVEKMFEKAHVQEGTCVQNIERICVTQ